MESVPNHKHDTELGILARAIIAICVIVATLAALGIMSSIRDRLQIAAEARLLLREPMMTWSAVGYADAGPFDFLEVDWRRLHAR